MASRIKAGRRIRRRLETFDPQGVSCHAPGRAKAHPIVPRCRRALTEDASIVQIARRNKPFGAFGDGLNTAVIPGHAEGVGPEPITATARRSGGSVAIPLEAPAVMGSGLRFRGPGMTQM